jgi:hypothetical protein
MNMAERGVRVKRNANEVLRSTYRKFVTEKGPSKKEEAGKKLIRVVFGKDAIAEDPIR